jgi:2-keto-4-pentenoate hydratase/2-oxohepta-3-ene-1,7-dioic acid hydratase in catechol pathway
VHQGQESIGFYDQRRVVPLAAAAEAFRKTGQPCDVPRSESILDYLPPDGPGFATAARIAAWIECHPAALPQAACLPADQARLLVPIPQPRKLFLLAGNYAAHIEEGGQKAAERQETFPYVFMKPPSTTLTHPGDPVRIPRVSPGFIDWELELVVVIGRKCKGVSETEALRYVAGYTIANDISNRKFRPNPHRKERPRDQFFDWLHGKWFDTFCPLGPGIASADAIPDPQTLALELKVNGQVRQSASTALMIFPVAAVIEFIAGFVTLEPGDMISTGTPSGVGHASGTYLRPGDVMEGTIERIGTLVTPVESET